MTLLWLHPEEIQSDYGINNSSLEFWRSYGCLALNGRKPRVKRAEDGTRRNLFLQEDIETIAAVSSANGRAKNESGAPLIDAVVAMKEHGVNRHTLERYRKLKKVQAQRKLTWVSGGRGEGRRIPSWFYLESDVIKIAELRLETAGQPSQETSLPAGEVQLLFGFTKHVLWHWRTQHCVHLGRKLLAEKRCLALEGNLTKRLVWVYSVADLRAIKERLATPEAGAFVNDDGEWWTAAKASKALKVPLRKFSYWRKRGRVQAKQIPTPPDKREGKAHKFLWVYNLQGLRQATGVPDGRTKEARQTAKLIDQAANPGPSIAGNLPEPVQAPVLPERPPTHCGRPKDYTDEQGEFVFRIRYEQSPRGTWDNAIEACRSIGFYVPEDEDPFIVRDAFMKGIKRNKRYQELHRTKRTK